MCKYNTLWKKGDNAVLIKYHQYSIQEEYTVVFIISIVGTQNGRRFSDDT